MHTHSAKQYKKKCFPSGDTAKGFGNLPFSRDEYSARNITLYVNIDLDQIRGYGLSTQAANLLILLSLYTKSELIEDMPLTDEWIFPCEEDLAIRRKGSFIKFGKLI
ncbi:MAG: hypothetical protein K9K63_06065 [Desulfotignum sp.]|nr:hypothetical protein [Desulfotignum sp.]MCF8136860.1 hypothetical protein [Desulfotignum sp.]